MKRDLELIKEILLQVEALPPGQSLDGDLYDSPFGVAYSAPDIVAEHVKLLEEADYIEAKITPDTSELGVSQVGDYSILRLKNDGHDFVANAKNPVIWKKTIDFVRSKSGDISLALLKGVLTKAACDHLGL